MPRVRCICEGGARHQTGASPKCAGNCPSDRVPGHLLTAPCKLLALASQRSQHDPYPQRREPCLGFSAARHCCQRAAPPLGAGRGQHSSSWSNLLGAGSIPIWWPGKSSEESGRQGHSDSKAELFLFLKIEAVENSICCI